MTTTKTSPERDELARMLGFAYGEYEEHVTPADLNAADTLISAGYGKTAKLLAALRAVEEIHHPSTDHGDGYVPYCVGCYEGGGLDGAATWPCPTVQAVRTSGVSS